MTKLLERAFARLRQLPDEDQDAVAVALLGLADRDLPRLELDEETLTAVREGMAEAERGEFASDAEIEALWKRYGL